LELSTVRKSGRGRVAIASLMRGGHNREDNEIGREKVRAGA